MTIKFKPIIKKIITILKRDGFEQVRMNGSHICFNKTPKLKRPIILVNRDRLSNAVRLNLIKRCTESGMDSKNIKELKELF